MREHDARATDADAPCRCRDSGHQDFRRGADDAVAVVMLRDPVALIAELVAQPRERERLADRDVLRLALRRGRLIEHRPLHSWISPARRPGRVRWITLPKTGVRSDDTRGKALPAARRLHVGRLARRRILYAFLTRSPPLLYGPMTPCTQSGPRRDPISGDGKSTRRVTMMLKTETPTASKLGRQPRMSRRVHARRRDIGAGR